MIYTFGIELAKKNKAHIEIFFLMLFYSIIIITMFVYFRMSKMYKFYDLRRVSAVPRYLKLA